MTTRDYTRPPVLDRIIQIEQSVSAPDAAYRYDQYRSFPTQPTTPGEYHMNGAGTLLVLNPFDADNERIPEYDEFEVGDTLTMVWGDYSITVTITVAGFKSIGFGNQTAAPQLEFDAPVNWDFGPVGVGDMMLTIGGGTAVENRPVWAARRDIGAVDSLLTTATDRTIVSRARYIIRYLAGMDIGDRFTDENGLPRTIEGIATIGRDEYLELLTKTAATNPGG